MEKEDQFASWAAKLENLESGVLDRLQQEFEREDTTDDVWHPLPTDSSQEVIEVKVKGEEEVQGNYQWGELKLFGGAVFQGRFSKDLKNREGKLYRDERSVKQTSISVSIGSNGQKAKVMNNISHILTLLNYLKKKKTSIFYSFTRYENPEEETFWTFSISLPLICLGSLKMRAGKNCKMLGCHKILTPPPTSVLFSQPKRQNVNISLAISS